MQLLTDEVDGSTSGMEALAQQGQTFSGLIKSLNTNAATTFGNMNTALAKMPPQMLATLAGALGIPLAAAEGSIELSKVNDQIQAAVANLITMNGDTALGKVKSQFDASLSASDKLNIAWKLLGHSSLQSDPRRRFGECNCVRNKWQFGC